MVKAANAAFLPPRRGAGPGGAENTDRVGKFRERSEPVDELALDTQDPPRVGVQPVGVLILVQQSLIGGGAIAGLRTTDEDRTSHVDGVGGCHGREVSF